MNRNEACIVNEDVVTRADYWPPRSKEIDFDWDLPTNERYKDLKHANPTHVIRATSDWESVFADSFRHARAKLDYNYHHNPQLERQMFQDAILKNILVSVEHKEHEGQVEEKDHPWIVFTAGPMGVGKSYVMSQLYQRDLFDLDVFVKIDPDMIKAELPEMAGYLQKDPESAATKLHRESTQMSDVLFETALQHKHNILVDGSLRDVDWYTQLFQRLRKEHAQYQLGIIYVSASEETIRNRATARAATTGRAVPEDLLQQSMEQVPKSVAALAPLTDVTFEITNNDQQPIEFTTLFIQQQRTDCSIDHITKWEDFRAVWRKPSANAQEEKQVEKEKRKRMISKQLHSFDDGREHEKANEIWRKAYPAFCARCTLFGGEQCGICIHNKHICACFRCNRRASVCSTTSLTKMDLSSVAILDDIEDDEE